MKKNCMSLETIKIINECKTEIRKSNFMEANKLLGYIISRKDSDSYSINFLNSYLLEQIKESSIEVDDYKKRKVILNNGIKFLNDGDYINSIKSLKMV